MCAEAVSRRCAVLVWRVAVWRPRHPVVCGFPAVFPAVCAEVCAAAPPPAPPSAESPLRTALPGGGPHPNPCHRGTHCLACGSAGDRLTHMSKRAKAAMEDPELEIQAVNTIRVLSADVVSKANSGHPGEKRGGTATRLFPDVVPDPECLGRAGEGRGGEVLLLFPPFRLPVVCVFAGIRQFQCASGCPLCMFVSAP